MSRFKKLFKRRVKNVVYKKRQGLKDQIKERSTKSGLIKALMPIASGLIFATTGIPPGTVETLFAAGMGVWAAYDIARKEPEQFAPENVIADFNDLLSDK